MCLLSEKPSLEHVEVHDLPDWSITPDYIFPFLITGHMLLKAAIEDQMRLIYALILSGVTQWPQKCYSMWLSTVT